MLLAYLYGKEFRVRGVPGVGGAPVAEARGLGEAREGIGECNDGEAPGGHARHGKDSPQHRTEIRNVTGEEFAVN